MAAPKEGYLARCDVALTGRGIALWMGVILFRHNKQPECFRRDFMTRGGTNRGTYSLRLDPGAGSSIFGLGMLGGDSTSFERGSALPTNLQTRVSRSWMGPCELDAKGFAPDHCDA